MTTESLEGSISTTKPFGCGTLKRDARRFQPYKHCVFLGWSEFPFSKSGCETQLTSPRSYYRAKDRLGLTLVQIADRYDKEVSIHASEKTCVAQNITQHEYARARLSAHYMVEYTYLSDTISPPNAMSKCSNDLRTMRVAFMSGAVADSRRCDFPEMHEIYDDTIETRNGYPLTTENVPFRPMLYLRERCKLTELFEEIHRLILRENEETKTTTRQFDSAIHGMSMKVLQWFTLLPPGLQYNWPMSTAVWELQSVRTTSHDITALC